MVDDNGDIDNAAGCEHVAGVEHTSPTVELGTDSSLCCDCGDNGRGCFLVTSSVSSAFDLVDAKQKISNINPYFIREGHTEYTRSIFTVRLRSIRTI